MNMKILSLSKRLALAGSILAVLFACQHKKNKDTDQNSPCRDESKAEVLEIEAPAAEESVVQIKEEPVQEPIAQEVVAPVSTPVAAPVSTPVSIPVSTSVAVNPAEPPSEPEVKAEAPKLEAVSAVSETSIPESDQP